MRCNICGCSEFSDFNNRKSVRCQACHSFERTRLLWLYIERLGITPDWRVLHLAPERGLYNRLSAMLKPDNYIAADYKPALFEFAGNCMKIDLTSMEGWESNVFDLILHSHVMEHIPCNIAYPIFHLHRMLRPNGTHLCIIPFMPGYYDECFDKLGREERVRRFGKSDHLRKFGTEDIPSHLGSVLNLPKTFDATDSFPEETLVECNIPESHWRGFQPGTVLSLRKGDYRLSA